MYSISGSAGTAVFLSVTTESKTLSADVTSNAVESGGEVNDHAVAKPVKLDVTGVVSEAGRLALEALQAARSLVTYQGKDSLNGCVITSLKLSSSSQPASRRVYIPVPFRCRRCAAFRRKRYHLPELFLRKRCPLKPGKRHQKPRKVPRRAARMGC